MKNFHIALLFSFSTLYLVTLPSIWGVVYTPVLYIVTFGVIQCIAAVYVFKKDRVVFDVIATASGLTLVYLALNLNIFYESRIVFLLIASFASLMVALKLRISFMKFMYSMIFLCTGVVTYFTFEPKPFLHIQNGALILVPILLAVAYVYAMREKGELDWFEKSIKQLHLLQLVPVSLFLFVWLYIEKFDIQYPLFTALEQYSYSSYNTLAAILLAGLIAVSLIIPRKFAGVLLPILASTVLLVQTCIIFTNPNSFSRIFTEELLVRIVYIAVIVAILVDVWRKGLIYQNFAEAVEKNKNTIRISAILLSIFLIFGLTNFFDYYQSISYNVAVMLNTVAIFVSAIIAFVWGNKQDEKPLKLFGIVLLSFGFIKMIFFDLSELELFVRSILFILIGGIGLIVSSKLMKK